MTAVKNETHDLNWDLPLHNGIPVDNNIEVESKMAYIDDNNEFMEFDKVFNKAKQVVKQTSGA